MTAPVKASSPIRSARAPRPRTTVRMPVACLGWSLAPPARRACPSSPVRPDADDRRGFSLVEVVVTLLLLSLLAMGAFLYLRDQQAQARAGQAASDLAFLRERLVIHAQAHGGRLPRDLSALPLRPNPPMDPWDTPYYFDPNRGLLGSAGPDRLRQGVEGPSPDDITIQVKLPAPYGTPSPPPSPPPGQ